MTSTFTHEIQKEKELLLIYVNPTKSGTSTYHPTIDWAKPNLAFSQSSPHHIPSMNVGSHGINQEYQTKAYGGQTTSNINQ